MTYEAHWLDIEQRERESRAYLKLNPMGRIPLAEFGDDLERSEVQGARLGRSHRKDAKGCIWLQKLGVG